MTARYDDVADSYAADGDDLAGAAISALLALVDPAPGSTALDLACGTGVIARELARRGTVVTGLDLSAGLLARARVHPDPVNAGIEYVEGDATDGTVLAGRSFDLVTCNFGLTDIDDLDALAATVARVLRPDGAFVFSMLHPCFAGTDVVSGSWPTDGTYYDERWWRADAELSVLRQVVGSNHRMVSTYINAFAAIGLPVERMVEPLPEPAWAANRPGAGVQPVYLVARCRRA